MLLALSPILRPLIIWVTQIVVTTVIADAISALLKYIVREIGQHYGIPEDDAKILLANQIIDIAALVGVGTGVLKSKLGVKAADYLGFTTSGVAKRTVTLSSADKVKIKDAAGASSPGILTRIGRFANGDNATRGLMALMLFQNVGDWYFFKRGLLQETLDKVFGKDTIPLPGESDAPPGFSKSEWDGFVASLEAAGVVGLQNQAAQQSQLYSREQLAILMLWVYGQQVKKGLSTGVTTLQKAVAPYLVFRGGSTPAVVTTPTAGAGSSVSAPAAPRVKVFTGVLSQGVLGAGLAFSARPDDLITSLSELRDAAEANIAAFIAALPSRVRYEIKVVHSVTTKDGFTQRGTAQQIRVGSYADGRPKYKTVVNKFAIANLYILSDKGVRSKISSIVLGPTDAINFQPVQADIQGLESALSGSITTSDLGEIGDVKIPGKDAKPVKPIDDEPKTSTTAGSGAIFKSGVYEYQGNYYRVDGKGRITAIRPDDARPPITSVSNPDLFTGGAPLPAPAAQRGSTTPPTPRQEQQEQSNPNIERITDPLTGNTYERDLSKPGDTYKPVAQGGGGGAAPTGSAPASGSAERPRVCGASTLFEFYSLRGESLPKVSVRSVIYEQKGLGKAAFYTGTAEQNTKLLRALQAEAGC